MMTLARVAVDHVHAVQRDLLCHRFRWEDLGRPEAEKLTLRQFASFVLGAEPTSALGHAVSEGWNMTNELLANIAEQHAGLIRLQGRYKRPGVRGELIKASEEKQKQRGPTANEVTAAVQQGGKFDRFDNPADFQKRLAAAKAKGKAS